MFLSLLEVMSTEWPSGNFVIKSLNPLESPIPKLFT
eukprot:SAG31_NODE_21025_length_559_cov_1.232609_2_plen_35_part_01